MDTVKTNTVSVDSGNTIETLIRNSFSKPLPYYSKSRPVSIQFASTDLLTNKSGSVYVPPTKEYPHDSFMIASPTKRKPCKVSCITFSAQPPTSTTPRPIDIDGDSSWADGDITINTDRGRENRFVGWMYNEEMSRWIPFGHPSLYPSQVEVIDHLPKATVDNLGRMLLVRQGTSANLSLFIGTASYVNTEVEYSWSNLASFITSDTYLSGGIIDATAITFNDTWVITKLDNYDVSRVDKITNVLPRNITVRLVVPNNSVANQKIQVGEDSSTIIKLDGTSIKKDEISKDSIIILNYNSSTKIFNMQ